MLKALSLISYFPFGLFFPRKLKFNLRIFRILPFVLVGTLLVLYVFQVNSVIQKTYFLQNYERKLNIISEGNKDLEIRLAQINTLENIEPVIKNLNYEQIGEIKYIQLMEPQVVAK